jgi:hypothetical protein
MNDENYLRLGEHCFLQIIYFERRPLKYSKAKVELFKTFENMLKVVAKTLKK